MSNIILIEDDRSIGVMLQQILSLAQVEVCLCTSGQECLSRLPSLKKPDLIVSDMLLPDTHVCDLLRQIRSHYQDDALPAIFTSARNLNEVPPEDLSMPFVEFWSKPFDLAKFISRVREIIDLGL